MAVSYMAAVVSPCTRVQVNYGDPGRQQPTPDLTQFCSHVREASAVSRKWRKTVIIFMQDSRQEGPASTSLEVPALSSDILTKVRKLSQ